MNIESLAQHLMLPDPWQHEAVNHLRAGADLIVSAPTGAGKTLIFELFVKSAKLRRQAVYTVPTRALANDKFAEWSAARWDVGLATGDLSENIGAPVLVATLETQTERLLSGDGPALLVLDEYQMISDSARGPHYEGAIVIAPADTQLLLLSGSVENPGEIAEWMRRLGRRVEVVATSVRPVPLEEVPCETLPQRVRGVEGWWPRLAAAVLQADLAPLLIFAPRRRDAESIAARLAARLPPAEPLSLTAEQRALAGREFASLLEKRLAYHHSGLGYAVRAGLVEPLAKAGQLRVIVSTMGLAAGINFSVRSVHVASTSFHDGLAEQTLAPDELLQMFGRAGRRGLDDRGYIITSRESPTLADARPARLRRSSRLSWSLFLRVMRRAATEGGNPFEAARAFAGRLFAKTPPDLGLDDGTGFELAGAAAEALFGLRAVRREMLNSEGVWEEAPGAPERAVPLAEAWLSGEDYRGPALGDARFVDSLAPGLGRVCRLANAPEGSRYGKEIALGSPVAEPTGAPAAAAIDPMSPLTGEITPTRALRRLLRIPGNVPTLAPEKVTRIAVPKLAGFFEGASFHGLVHHGGLVWARFDFSSREVACLQDGLGRWIAAPRVRSVEREAGTEIRSGASGRPHAARPGTPVHAWRSLGLIEEDGVPTRRGIIFSFFQHGEGLAIAAALEDPTYPLDELALHLANLRSDCRFEPPEPGGSERLAATCRATYGYVNHHGYLEAGLPLGYGEGTAELLGLAMVPSTGRKPRPPEISEGDLSRAYIEWLSLLRHITHAPDFDWPRWRGVKETAGRLLASHLGPALAILHPRLPSLTPKQRHERPSHRFR